MEYCWNRIEDSVLRTGPEPLLTELSNSIYHRLDSCENGMSQEAQVTTKNGTQKEVIFWTSFSWPSCGVIHFVRGFSSRNHLRPPIRSIYSMVFEADTRNKWNTSCERTWNTEPENVVSSLVPFCLRSFERIKRCDVSNLMVKSLPWVYKSCVQIFDVTPPFFGDVFVLDVAVTVLLNDPPTGPGPPLPSAPPTCKKKAYAF